MQSRSLLKALTSLLIVSAVILRLVPHWTPLQAGSFPIVTGMGEC